MDLLRLLFALGILTVVSVALAVGLESVGESACVSVLHVDGPIVMDAAGPGFSSSRQLVQAIEEFESSSSPALLLDINSPGGSAVASSDIYEALRASNKTKVAYFNEVAASGGYYVAAGTQYIVANPNTITGSIGAVSDLINYEELFNKIGLRQEAIKSGELKDIGAGYRNMTEKERALLQDLINETAAHFVADVRAGRSGKLTPAFEQVLDARIVSASGALNAGLIDQIGSRNTALLKAANLSGLGNELPSECDITPQAPPITDLFSSIGFSLGEGFRRGVTGPSTGAVLAR